MLPGRVFELSLSGEAKSFKVGTRTLDGRERERRNEGSNERDPEREWDDGGGDVVCEPGWDSG